MAEATAFRNNALPYPCYGMAWTVVFPLLDADGDPVSPSSPDSERSLNGDTFADCTNEATEIATSTGVCYLTLTAAEMTADIVAVRVQSTGAKTTVITLYPRKLVVLSSGTCQGSNDTGDIQLASGEPAIDNYYNGCLCVAVIDSVTEARIINDYVGSTKVAEISPAWNTAQPDSNDTYTIYLPEGRQVNQADPVAWNGTAVPSPHTAGYPIVTIKDGTGTGEINTNAGAIALVDAVTTLTTYTGNTPQTGDSYAIVNSGTHGNAAIKGFVDDIGVAGAGLSAIPWNASWDAEVESEANDALVALKLDHLIAVADADDAVDNSIIAKLASKGATADWSSFVNTTDSLEAIADSSSTPPTAAAIADAVWDEAQADHVAAGSFGILASEIASILDDTESAGVVVASGSKTGYALSSAAIDAIIDEVIEGSYTLRQLLRGFGAALLGKASGLPTAPVYRNASDSKAVITATTDSDGNRTAVTLDLT